MTLLLLHGPAKIASRQKLSELRQKFDRNNTVIFEEGSNMRVVLDSLSVPSLFDGERLIIAENPLDDCQSCLSADRFSIVPPSSLTFVLWFDHKVDAKKWPDFRPLFFPEGKEVSVFPFLDLLLAKDKQAFLEMEKLTRVGFDIHYCLTMVFYCLRSLVRTPQHAPGFVIAKLQRQRKNFTMEKITRLYKDILEIDFKIKKGYLEETQARFLLLLKFLGH